MERDFGTQIVSSFGKRLQRTYSMEEISLPQEMRLCLERLESAEREQTRSHQTEPQIAAAAHSGR